MTSQKKMAEQKARNVSQKEGSQQQNEIEQDSAGEDASALIRSDHRKVEALFSEFEEAHSEEKKAELVTDLHRTNCACNDRGGALIPRLPRTQCQG